MKIPYVKNIHNNLKSLSFKNLHSIVTEGVNADIDNLDNVRIFILDQLPSVKPEKRIINVYKANDIIFYYVEGGILYYQRLYGSLQCIDDTFSSMPIIIPVNINGKKAAFVKKLSGMAYLVDGGANYQAYTLPSGHLMCEYNNMLFIADGNTLLFSTIGDYTDFTMDLNHGGYINLNAVEGQIMIMATVSDKLILFTEKAIYEFIAIGKRLDYKLERVMEIENRHINYNSVKPCLEQVVFVENDKLYAYKNGIIEQIDSCLDQGKYSTCNSFGYKDNVYYILLRDQNSSYSILRYDFDGHRQCLIPCNNCSVNNEGLFVDKNKDLYVDFQIHSPYMKGTLNCKEMDFDCAKDKVIHKISMYSELDGILTVKSDIGEKTFKLKKGVNVKRMNIPTSSLWLSFTGGNGFFVDNIKIEYRIKEG